MLLSAEQPIRHSAHNATCGPHLVAQRASSSLAPSCRRCCVRCLDAVHQSCMVMRNQQQIESELQRALQDTCGQLCAPVTSLAPVVSLSCTLSLTIRAVRQGSWSIGSTLQVTWQQSAAGQQTACTYLGGQPSTLVSLCRGFVRPQGPLHGAWHATQLVHDSSQW